MKCRIRAPGYGHRSFARMLLRFGLCLVVGLAACTRPLAPGEVAEQFWRAAVAGDPAALARHVLAGDRARLAAAEDMLPVSTFTLGRIVIDGERATVHTRITLAGETPLTLEFDTVLRRESETWRVDYPATVDAVTRQGELARVIGRIGTLREALERGVEQSLEEMRRMLPAIERELARIERELEQQIPPLRERVESFVREIEKALKGETPPTSPSPEPPVSEGAIAL